MVVLCTLFDSYYLDRGIVLYNSLERVSKDFILYIFCFDDKSYEVLKKYDMKHAVIIHHSEFEYEELLKVKGERSKAEYCWTCKSVTMEYVFTHYGEKECTYIDSDLYFSQDPQLLLDEIRENHADAAIVSHRLTDSRKDRRIKEKSGVYCAEYIYFNTSENSQKILSWWKARCIEWCYHIHEPERFGDQKYLMKFPVLFENVHELEHLGGGVAPWNLNQYNLVKKDGNDIILKEKCSGKEFPLVFYHFQNLKFIGNNLINISSETHNKQLKEAIYRNYLRELMTVRKDLFENYGISFSTKKKYSSNKFRAFVQSTILRFKTTSLSDIYRIDRL